MPCRAEGCCDVLHRAGADRTLAALLESGPLNAGLGIVPRLIAGLAFLLLGPFRKIAPAKRHLDQKLLAALARHILGEQKTFPRPPPIFVRLTHQMASTRHLGRKHPMAEVVPVAGGVTAFFPATVGVGRRGQCGQWLAERRRTPSRQIRAALIERNTEVPSPGVGDPGVRAPPVGRFQTRGKIFQVYRELSWDDGPDSNNRIRSLVLVHARLSLDLGGSRPNDKNSPAAREIA